MTWATYQEAMEAVDEFAADNPLEALRHYSQYLNDYRLDACAIVEPAAALVHAHDRLTAERRASCEAAISTLDRKRYFPDRIAAERLALIRRLEGRL